MRDYHGRREYAANGLFGDLLSGHPSKVMIYIWLSPYSPRYVVGLGRPSSQRDPTSSCVYRVSLQRTWYCISTKVGKAPAGGDDITTLPPVSSETLLVQ